jgi:hypothetical protein
MKKVMFLLLTVLSVVAVKSQTYQKNIARINSDICGFQNKLNETKDRIYYLEVTLINKIMDDSLKTISKQKYPLSGANNLEQLRKERFFAKDELIILYNQKGTLEKAIMNLKETLLSGKEKIAKEVVVSRIPERMSRFEYKQRTRSLMYKASEGILSGSGQSGLFDGLLVNYKIGRNEITTFTIININFPEFPPVIKTLNPEERLYVALPVGDYQVTVTCGSFSKAHIFNVSPLVIKRLDGKNVYWGSYKAMSDM